MPVWPGTPLKKRGARKPAFGGRAREATSVMSTEVQSKAGDSAGAVSGSGGATSGVEEIELAPLPVVTVGARSSSFKTAYRPFRRDSSGSRRSADSTRADLAASETNSPRAQMPSWEQVSCASGAPAGTDPFPAALPAAAPAAAVVLVTRHGGCSSAGAAAGSSRLEQDPFPDGSRRGKAVGVSTELGATAKGDVDETKGDAKGSTSETKGVPDKDAPVPLTEIAIHNGDDEDDEEMTDTLRI